jgi:hypothetical protein
MSEKFRLVVGKSTANGLGKVLAVMEQERGDGVVLAELYHDQSKFVTWRFDVSDHTHTQSGNYFMEDPANPDACWESARADFLERIEKYL